MSKKRKKALKAAREKLKAPKATSLIALPTDRNGMPIHIGDVLMWDGGDTIRVESLTYYGDEFESLGFRWVANEDAVNDKERSDNLGCGEIIWKKGDS